MALLLAEGTSYELRELQIVRDTIAKKPEHFNMINFLGASGNNVKCQLRRRISNNLRHSRMYFGYTVAILEPNNDIFGIAKLPATS